MIRQNGSASVAVPFPPPTSRQVPESPFPLSEPAYLRGLNPPQREAVLTTEGPVLVLAGAGTGKTAALTARLAHLIATRKAWPSQILAVTFTNKAAREMRERVGALSGGALEGMPWLGTFHSVAARMLRRHAELVGLQSNFTILDTDDQLRVLKQLIQRRRPRREAMAGAPARRPDRPLEEPRLDSAPGRCRRSRSLRQRPRRRALRAIPGAPADPQRLRLRRPPASHAGDPPHACRRARALPRPLPLHPRRRISGHQPGAVRLAAPARRAAQEPLLSSATTTSRSIPGAAPRSPTSSASRRISRAPRSSGSSRITARPATSSPPPTASSRIMPAGSARRLWTDAGEGEKVHVIGIWDGPEEARRVGEELESAHAPRRLSSTTARSWSAPSSRPASSRTASSRSACPTGSSAASASTSAPRSATRSLICG